MGRFETPQTNDHYQPGQVYNNKNKNSGVCQGEWPGFRRAASNGEVCFKPANSHGFSASLMNFQSSHSFKRKEEILTDWDNSN